MQNGNHSMSVLELVANNSFTKICRILTTYVVLQDCDMRTNITDHFKFVYQLLLTLVHKSQFSFHKRQTCIIILTLVFLCQNDKFCSNKNSYL